jgi:2'-5' RNA ligase
MIKLSTQPKYKIGDLITLKQGAEVIISGTQDEVPRKWVDDGKLWGVDHYEEESGRLNINRVLTPYPGAFCSWVSEDEVLGISLSRQAQDDEDEFDVVARKFLKWTKSLNLSTPSAFISKNKLERLFKGLAKTGFIDRPLLEELRMDVIVNLKSFVSKVKEFWKRYNVMDEDEKGHLSSIWSEGSYDNDDIEAGMDNLDELFSFEDSGGGLSYYEALLQPGLSDADLFQRFNTFINFAHQRIDYGADWVEGGRETLDELAGYKKVFKKKAADFTCIMLEIDKQESIYAKIKAIAKKIKKEDLSEDGREDDLHVTLKYGLDTEDPALIRPLLDSEGKITLEIKKLDYFGAKETKQDFDVVILRVDSDQIQELHETITDTFKDSGETHPKYLPHITLAYVKRGLGKDIVIELRKDAEDLIGKKIVFKEALFSTPEEKKTVIKLSRQIVKQVRLSRQG